MSSTLDTSNLPKTAVSGLQIIFVAFGALVVVPLITGLDTSVALFTAGVGTLIFQIITRWKVPIFLASSFAFIPAITAGVATWGIPGAMCGLIAAGLFYVLISALVYHYGVKVIHKLFPPIVIGPVIAVIGLSLAPTAVTEALGQSGGVQVVPIETSLIIAAITLITALLCFAYGKGWTKLIPIIIALAVGYILSIIFGIVDFTTLTQSEWVAVPNFVFPEWNLAAILFMIPFAIAPAVEHFGDILTIGSVTGKDYTQDPGIHRTMLGDGIATAVAAFFSGPPNTTYSEVTGAVALTKSFNPLIMTFGAIFAIIFAFIAKINGLLQTIPLPVLGGVMILLFGLIASLGINQLVRNNIDVTDNKNLIIISIILVAGVGGLYVPIFGIEFGGVGLAAVIGVLLNLILPDTSLKTEGEN